MKNNEANTTIIKISSELILSNLFNNGVAFLATIKNRSIYPKAIPIEVRAPKKEAHPQVLNQKQLINIQQGIYLQT